MTKVADLHDRWLDEPAYQEFHAVSEGEFTLARELIAARVCAGLTQEQLAASLDIKQPTLSHLESQDDMQISTLRRIVEKLGGDLEIIATLPSGRVSLSQFKNSR